MISRGWPALLITLLAALAIGIGLALTGGPGTARQERRDQSREADLSRLAVLVRCLADANGRRLPERLQPSPDCAGQARLQDPFSGAPYRYQVIGPRRYRLCADFELPEDRPRELADRDAGGCVSRDYVPSPPGDLPLRP